MSKYGLYKDGEAARLAVFKDEVDVAVIESGNTGITLFKIKGRPSKAHVPEKLTKLPGFKFSSVSVSLTGVPAPPVCAFKCYRTSVEVCSVLEDI